MAGKRASVYQILRLVFIILLFFSGCLSIVFSQTIIILTLKDPVQKQKALDFTKESFVILLTFVNSICSPTEIIITHDDSIPKGSFVLRNKKNLLASLDPNAIIISNHQIYSDWLFLWWCAYINNTADSLYIIMKKSLRKIPVLGYGMYNYGFMFLSRKWEEDKNYMIESFGKIADKGKLDKSLNKSWLLIFPEGTNLSANTRSKSDVYVAKAQVKPLKHVLLPRVKGLYLAVKHLQKSTKTIYDFTFVYSGHSALEYAQDIYTLGKIYLYGKGPKSVNIHVKSYMIDDIPGFNNPTKPTQSLTEEEEEQNILVFQEWVYNVWYSKDKLMDNYYESGDFIDPERTNNEELITNLKLASRAQILSVFAIPTITVLMCYGIFWFVRYLTAM